MGDVLKDKIQFIALSVLCCFSILPTSFQSISIISFVCISIILNFRILKKEIKSKTIKVFLVASVWLILLYLTILYSMESKAGLIYIRKSINIIIIPFVIFYAFPKLNKKQIHLLFKIFIFSNVLFVVYLCSTLVNNLSFEYLPALKQVSFFDKIKLILNAPHSEIIWHGIKKGGKTTLLIHKTYLSLNLVFSVFIIIHLFIKKRNKVLINLLWGSLAVFLSIPVFYFIPMVNIPLLIFGVGLLILLKVEKKKQKIILGLSYVLLVTIFGIITINHFNSNDKVLLTSVSNKVSYIYNIFGQSDIIDNKGMDKRTFINNCAKNLFIKKPVFGYGLGEQHIHLTGCYAEKKDFVLVEDNYNTHNHYYFLLLSGGLIVLLPFLYMLFYFFKYALMHKNYLFVLFLVLIAANLFIENILSRINGIIFFALFLPLLFRYNYLNTKDS